MTVWMFDLVICVCMCVWQIKILQAFVFWFLHCFIKKILEFARFPHLVPTCVCEQEVGVGEEVRGRWMFPVRVTAPDRYFILHKLPQLSLISDLFSSSRHRCFFRSLVPSLAVLAGCGVIREGDFGDYQTCEKSFIWSTLWLYTNLKGRTEM